MPGWIGCAPQGDPIAVVLVQKVAGGKPAIRWAEHTPWDQPTRASAAARAGIEWGLYQAFKGSWTACSNTSSTLDTGNGLRVTVLCDSRSFNEGESSPGVARTVRAFTIDAVACRSSSASSPCPDAAAAVQPAMWSAGARCRQ